MRVSDEIRKLIIQRVSASEISKVAITEGMKTLRDVAFDKVREGVSTFEQVAELTANH